ncbi:MAG: DUF1122 family protein [Dehalococcoidia bacterium]
MNYQEAPDYILSSPEQSGLSHWLDKGWRAAGGGEHPLGVVSGQRLGGTTILVLLGPKNRVGARYFQIFLVGDQGQVSQQPVVIGLYNSGPYPSYNWVEIISLAEHITFASSTKGEGRMLDIGHTGLDRELLKRIADLIPPGGHMMIEYDSPGQRETARSLGLGVPAAATPLGYLLYSIGCGAGFKDWHFAEGGSEGSRKLQGYKPLNESHARESARDLARGLLEFLNRPLDPGRADMEEPARQRAVEILSHIDVNDGDLRQAIQRALHGTERGLP